MSRLDRSCIECVTIVDEVVAGERMAVPGDVLGPELRVGQTQQARQNLPAAHANVVRNYPVHIRRRPAGLLDRALRDESCSREIRRHDFIAERVCIPVIPLRYRGCSDKPVSCTGLLHENGTGGVRGAVEDRLSPGVHREELGRDTYGTFDPFGDAEGARDAHRAEKGRASQLVEPEYRSVGETEVVLQPGRGILEAVGGAES